MSTKAKASEMTRAEWQAEGERRFGDDPRDWAFVCPICGGRQSGRDFLALPDDVRPEMVSNVVYYSCIGRYLPASSVPRAFGRREVTMTPETHCDYTSGGLFCVNDHFVVTDNGRVPVFAFAEPEARS